MIALGLIAGCLAAGLATTTRADPPRDDPATSPDVLERHGLRRSGRFFVLPAEGEARAGIAAIADAQAARQEAYGRIAEVLALDEEIAGLVARQTELDDAIKAMALRMGSIPRRNATEKAVHHSLLLDQVGLKDRKRQVDTALKICRQKSPAAPARKQMMADADEADRLFREAVTAARAQVNELAARYKELKASGEVASALDAAQDPKGRPSARIRIGPSEEFQRGVSDLARAEKELKFLRPAPAPRATTKRRKAS